MEEELEYFEVDPLDPPDPYVEVYTPDGSELSMDELNVLLDEEGDLDAEEAE